MNEQAKEHKKYDITSLHACCKSISAYSSKDLKRMHDAVRNFFYNSIKIATNFIDGILINALSADHAAYKRQCLKESASNNNDPVLTLTDAKHQVDQLSKKT